MKYGLVLIEFEDDVNLNDLQIDYQVLKKDGDDYFDRCVTDGRELPIIPLPAKITEFVEYDDEHELEEVCENSRSFGFNDCLEGIQTHYKLKLEGKEDA